MNHPQWLRRLAAETTLLETEQTEPRRLCHFLRFMAREHFKKEQAATHEPSP